MLDAVELDHLDWLPQLTVAFAGVAWLAAMWGWSTTAPER
jgi:hypothetical protein